MARRLPTGSRAVLARWLALAGGRSLIPPRFLHSVGRSDFVETGEEFFRYFTERAGLTPHERVLDVGCGTGRMARPLTRYLTDGRYDGVDVVGPSIAWCQAAYRRFPSFRFHHADVHNQVYNPKGSCPAGAYRLPFADSSFDLVTLTSVFTHMLPADVAHYLGEIARVLRPGGRCLATYFLLNADALAGMASGAASIDFPHEADGCRVNHREVPEQAVAYEEARVRALYARCGLAVREPIVYGTWCGRGGGLSYQDLVIASRAADASAHAP